MRPLKFLVRNPSLRTMDAAATELAFGDEERTSGVYAKARRTTEAIALEELRAITGEETVAVLLFATQGRPPAGASYPARGKRLEGPYSLTHRLVSWLTAFTRASATDVPSYLKPWFPSTSVIVVPICTPEWQAGCFVVPRACAVQAREIRSLAADIALRLAHEERRESLARLELFSR